MVASEKKKKAGKTAVPIEPKERADKVEPTEAEEGDDDAIASPDGDDSGSAPPSRPDTGCEAEAEDGLGALPDRLSTAATVTTVKKTRKKLKKLTVNLTLCRYKVIKDVMAELGWKETEHETEWHLLWTDMSVSEGRCMKLRRMQRLNHFPAMTCIAHKCQLARNINRLRQALPEEFDFHPETFNLPVDRQAFEACVSEVEGSSGKRKAHTFIIKPDDGACGQGIFLTRKGGEVPSGLACVAQRYLTRPLLIDKRKFDLRLYVLVTSMTPLRCYLHHHGLARFASDKYDKVTNANIKQSYMHLTNYSVNKHHPDFQVLETPKDLPGAAAGGAAAGGERVLGDDDDDEEEAVGGKRSAEWVREWLARNGYDVPHIWGEIEGVVVKTLLAVQPQVGHAYRSCLPDNRDAAGFSCFDILGFDIMLDADGRPWLIEVNQMPSWETSSPLDKQAPPSPLLPSSSLLLLAPSFPPPPPFSPPPLPPPPPFLSLLPLTCSLLGSRGSALASVAAASRWLLS